MRTTSYEEYLRRVCAQMGFPRDDLQEDEEFLYNQYFNRAITRIWEAAPWPQVCAIEERTPTSPSSLVRFVTPGETDIGHVFAVYDKDPDGTVSFKRLPYRIYDDGLKLVNTSHTGTVWVHFRKPCPLFSGDLWVAGREYDPGDQVYNPTTGQFYVCQNATTTTPYTVEDGNDELYAPGDEPWLRLNIPADWLDYLVYSAYSDALLGENQTDKGFQQRSMADAVMRELMDVLERQQGVITQPVIKTYFGAYQS